MNQIHPLEPKDGLHGKPGPIPKQEKDHPQGGPFLIFAL